MFFMEVNHTKLATCFAVTLRVIAMTNIRNDSDDNDNGDN